MTKPRSVANTANQAGIQPDKLASNIPSAKIDFSLDSAEAEARTVEDKLNDTANIADFGGVGDGSDSTSANDNLLLSGTVFGYRPGEYEVNDRTFKFNPGQIGVNLPLTAQLQTCLSHLSQVLQDDFGDSFPNFLRRTVQFRYAIDANNPYTAVAVEGYNTTACAYVLRLTARLAEIYPSQAPLMEIINSLAETIISFQYKDNRTARFGGIALALNERSASTFGSAYCGLALCSAYRVTRNPIHLQAAVNIGEFVKTTHSPNAKYQALYGITPIVSNSTNDSWRGFCDEISPNDTITVTNTTWNLMACWFLKELNDLVPDPTYVTIYTECRDWQSTGLTGFYDFWVPLYPGALPSMTSNNWFASGIEKQDGQWHRRGEDVTVGGLAVNTIGSDQVEYAIEALYETGYSVSEIKTAYEILINAPNADTGSFGQAYDSTICWPGFFRINAPVYGGETRAFGSHYDVQGAGPLLKFKYKEYPAHFSKSMSLYQEIDLIGTLVNQNFDTVKSSDPSEQFQFATIGNGTVKGVVLMGLLEAMNG